MNVADMVSGLRQQPLESRDERRRRLPQLSLKAAPVPDMRLTLAVTLALAIFVLGWLILPQADTPVSTTAGTKPGTKPIVAPAGLSKEGLADAVRGVVSKVSEAVGRDETKTQKEATGAQPEKRQNTTAKSETSANRSANGKAGAQGKEESAKPARKRIIADREVVSGDYMRKLADRYYGNEMLWPLIWDYNKKRARESGYDMSNPDLIYPGWQLLIPEKKDKEADN